MKLHHTLLLGIALFAAASCSEVDESNRFDGPYTVEAKKNVLVEDFTGQTCTNCPLANDEMVNILSNYGTDRVIAVSLHGGSNSLREDGNKYGLANVQGYTYISQLGINSFPKGRIDRQGDFIDYDKWDAEIFKRFSNDYNIQLSIDNNATSFNLADSTLTVKVNVENQGSTSITGKLQVWLTESNIVGPQYQTDGKIDMNYTHNHVFRHSVNDFEGEQITLNASSTESKTYSYTFPGVANIKNKTPWQPANMHYVVIFYNEGNGVMQVIERGLLKAEAE